MNIQEFTYISPQPRTRFGNHWDVSCFGKEAFSRSEQDGLEQNIPFSRVPLQRHEGLVSRERHVFDLARESESHVATVVGQKQQVRHV